MYGKEGSPAGNGICDKSPTYINGMKRATFGS